MATHPILNQITDINYMQVGDCIPCRYTATQSGVTGYFWELGTCTTDEIPVNGTATPDGLFYFIKVAKGTLVADRVIQTNISWDTLNTAGLIEYKNINMIPTMTNNTSPIGIASSNQIYSTLLDAYKLFDGSDITDYASPSPAIFPVIVGYEFNLSTIINRYEITASSSPAYSPKSWTFEGSNDGTNWIILDTQNNITSWNNKEIKIFNFINTSKYKMYRLNISVGNNIQVQFSSLSMFNKNIFIRSLTGGCTYIDSNNNPSMTNQNLGAWPPNNEWDTYIVKSTLNDKITAGDNNIWHWQTPIWGTWCKDTWNISLYANTYRMIRGSTVLNVNTLNGLNYSISSTYSGNWGFRPVLEYLEPNSKASNLFY